LLPLSNPDFESGPPSAASIETARVIDRGIRESKALDTKGLCITKGEKVWTIAIDIVPINYDGNLIGMGGFAALAALLSARMPEVVDGKVDYHKRTNVSLKLNSLPIPITVGKMGDIFVVDPTAEEEKVLDVRLTVTTLDDKNLCALQKGGDAPLSKEDIDKMVDIAFEKASILRKKLKEAVKC
jgi:exosome complex component RRP42